MPTLAACTGFEFRTTAGWLTGNLGNRLFDIVTGTPAIVTTVSRTGAACLQLDGTANQQRLEWDTNTFGTGKTSGIATVYIRFNGVLPSTDTILVGINSIGTANSWVQYVASSGRLAGQVTSGVQQPGPLVVPNVWYRIDMHYNVASNPQTLDWQVNGAAQTRATTAIAASTIAEFQLGWNTNATASVQYDDWCISTTLADFPLGSHKVVLLSVDPTDTVTLSGTAANFNTFSANGTLAAWDATVARDAVDEVPPTIGASADGWAQITTAATDYVEMPLTSYALVGNESVSGARMEAVGWAASTTANAIGFRSWNGTTERTLFAAADPNFDNSTTTPAWVCKMLTTTDIDTQSELDALAIRAGFSSDAGVDVGIHAVYVELAVKDHVSTEVVPLPALELTSQLPGFTNVPWSPTPQWLIWTGADAPAASPVDWTVDQTDSVGLTDAVTFEQRYEITDSVGLTDTSTVELVKLVTTTDNVGLTDTTAFDRALVQTDSVGLTDTTAVSQTKAFTDSAGLTDTAVVQLVKLVTQTDSAGLTDTTTFSQAKVVTDSAGLTDTQEFQQAKVITDSVGLTDTFAPSFDRSLTDSVGLTDNQITSQGFGRVIEDLVGLTDSLIATSVTNRTLTDSVGLTDEALVNLGAPPATPLSSPSGVVDLRFQQGVVDLRSEGETGLRSNTVEDLGPATGTVDIAPSENN